MNDISNNQNKINLDDGEPSFIDEITAQPEGDTIYNCFSCGTCVAGCPVRRASDQYNPREIIRLILTGQRETVLKSTAIWYCSTCYTCQERCPQGVHIPSLLMALRNLASQDGLAPYSHEKQKELILELGRLYEIDEFDNKKRTKVDLPPIVTSNKTTSQLYESLKKERLSKRGLST